MVGQGYVGLPVAMRAVEVGYSVVGFDASAERVKSLQRGESYVGDISDEEQQRALTAGYLPTADAADVEGFDIAMISVPTPLRDSAPDLSLFPTRAEARRAIFRWVNWYNTTRLHSTLNYTPPAEWEQQYRQAS